MNRRVYDALSTIPGERMGQVFRKASGAAWGSMRTAFDRAVSEAKLQDFRFHDLRHTAASWLIQRGRSSEPGPAARSRRQPRRPVESQHNVST